jgi:hypothetical protein
MGADKKSSPKREVGLYPKFTTKDPHMSFPRSRNHNGPTNPRNKPQTIPKRKHDSRSKGLSCPVAHQADRPRPPGGPSVGCGGLSEKRSPTTSTAPSITDCPRWARGPPAPSWTVRHSSMDRPRTSCNKNPPTQWIERKTRKNSRRTRRTLGLSGSSRTVRQEKFLQLELDPLKVHSTFPLPDLSNQPRDCYQIIGEDEVSLGDAIPTNL